MLQKSFSVATMKNLRSWSSSSLKENLMLVFVSLVLTLICVEVIFRIVSTILPDVEIGGFYDSYSGEPPNHYYRFGINDTIVFSSDDEFNYRLVTNKDGFFDRPFPDVFPDSTIVAFGDSFTQGHGADSTETWPRYLQDCLSSQNYPWSIYNCGVAGCDPFFNFVAFRDLIIQKKPSHVILCINETDVTDFISRGGIERFCKDGSVKYRSPSFKYRLFRFSSVFRYISINTLDYNYMGMTEAEFSTSTERSKVSLKNLINDFNALASKNGIGFTLVIMPFPGPNKPISVGGELMDFSVDRSIHTINLFEYFSRDSVFNNINSYYWPKDGHFTSEGYKSFAKGICTQLDFN